VIIHQIWVGSRLPDHLREMTETWQSVHPTWDYRLWTDDTIDALGLTNRDLYDRASELVPADAIGQYRADIARYEILHRFGGVYADTDTTCQRHLGGILPAGQLVAGWEVQDKWIGNTVIAAPTGHPALTEIIDALPALADRLETARPNRLSGPKAITPLLRGRADVTIVDQEIFYPVGYHELERSTEDHPDAYVVHHWQHQRDLKGIT